MTRKNQKMNGGRSSMPNDRASDRLLLVVGVPGTRRTDAVLNAAVAAGYRRVQLLPYTELFEYDVPPIEPGTLIRLESPSGCDATTRGLLQLGSEPLAVLGGTSLTQVELANWQPARGEMQRPRQWFLGYRRLLERLEAAWDSTEPQWMSHPTAILTAFDKLACLERWNAVDLPTPPRHLDIHGYEHLRSRIAQRHARIFIKLRYGYSALGAVALEWRDSLVRAITPMCVEEVEGKPRLFLSKRPQVLHDESRIAWLIDELAKEDIIVEDWLPKARYRGVPYDLRVVMVGGQVQHVVGRANSSPFTNLNLDAERLPRDAIEAELGDAWTDLELLCEQAASCLPSANMLGLDVLVRPGRKRFSLLEANAFGDYLPGLLHHGQSTYEWQFRESLHNLVEV
jgi:hypothetical protein